MQEKEKVGLEDKSVSKGIVSFGCARYNEGDTELLFAVVKELYLSSLYVRFGGSGTVSDGSRITLDRPCPILGGTRKACEEARRILGKQQKQMQIKS